MTTALEGGEGSALRPGRCLPPGNTRYPFYRRLGEPQDRSGQVRKISPSPGFDPRTVQPVASHYTDCATQPTHYMVKCTLGQALMLCTGRTAHRGNRGIAVPFLDHGTRRGWGVSFTSRPLFTPVKDPVPIIQEAGWAPGPVWTSAENLALTGIRTPGRPARSQSLYRLNYPGPHVLLKWTLEVAECGLDGIILAQEKIPTVEVDVRRYTTELGLDSAGLGKIQVAGICESGNVRSGTVKHGEFRDWLNHS